MDDWEDFADDAPSTTAAAAAPGLNVWDDEEEDSDGLLDDWDAEPEKTETPKPKPKKESARKIAARQERLEREARERAARMTKEEKLAAKMEEQRRVEEADHELTEDLFMGAAPDVAAVDVQSFESVLQNLDLDKTEDFEELASKLSVKVREEGNVIQQVKFAQEIIKLMCEGMKLEDINKIKSTMTVVYNDARKAQTGKKKKKKKKSKAHLNTGSAGAEYDDYGESAFNDVDEFDFI